MELEKLTPRAVIFDLGSTLISYPSTMWDEISDQCIANAREFMMAQGHDMPSDAEFVAAYRKLRDGYRKSSGETLVEWSVDQLAQKMIEQAGVTVTDELIGGFFDAYYAKLEPHIDVYEDTAEVLARISERYGTVGLVSNTIFPERAHLDELERFGLAEFLTFKVFSSTFGVRKPRADIFYQAANLAGCAPSECVYIGDRYLEDVTGPNEIGMPAILKWHENREYPDDMPYSTRQVKTLSELVQHFDF
jgi:putative hydrolase of the HAD superfamily